MSNLRMTFEEMLASQDKIRKPLDDEEHRIQSSCVYWFRAQYPMMEHNLFAVPNGTFKKKAARGKFKAEGLLAGVADLIFLKSNSHYGALLIEVKTKDGRQSESQKAWQKKIECDGFHYVIVRSLEDFQREIREYLACRR